jgi:NADH-quinone oxidoreductase subunit N
LIYGISLVYGSGGTTSFNELAGKAALLSNKTIFLVGLLLVLVGLGFKIAAFPFQIWTPDVYQGAPVPTTAFLAVGSKAAGFVLLLRLLFSVVPGVTNQWTKLLVACSAITILYGNLCAIPQRNLKRLLGYSSIANAGYLLLGVAALNQAGSAAILYYFAGYLFTVLAAFTVVCLVVRRGHTEDLSLLAGLNQRSPLLAATMTLAMVSLAGVPPLAGFIGKFLLLKAVVARGAAQPIYYCLLAVAIFGVVISLYYYFGIIRAIYWSRDPADLAPSHISWPMKISLYSCIAGMLYLGLFPNAVVNLAEQAVKVLRWG